jgi:hypothetical protein
MHRITSQFISSSRQFYRIYIRHVFARYAGASKQIIAFQMNFIYDQLF